MTRFSLASGIRHVTRRPPEEVVQGPGPQSPGLGTVRRVGSPLFRDDAPDIRRRQKLPRKTTSWGWKAAKALTAKLAKFMILPRRCSWSKVSLLNSVSSINAAPDA
jgi:hypothetical protein